jgi:hypothetical protein
VGRNVRSALYTNEPSRSAQQNFIRNQHLLVREPWVYVMPLAGLAVGVARSERDGYCAETSFRL